MEACHKLSNDGAHTLMLNPIHTKGNDIGKIKFSMIIPLHQMENRGVSEILRYVYYV